MNRDALLNNFKKLRIFLVILFLLFETNFPTKSHAHFQHDGVNYGGGIRLPTLPSDKDALTHYRCEPFISTSDGSSLDEEFEITFNQSGAEIARREKKGSTLPSTLTDISSKKLGDWTNRYQRTYWGMSPFGYYNQIFVVQSREEGFLKIYRTIMLPYSKNKQNSLDVSSCEIFH